MEGLTKLFRYAFAPESDWGKFSRKVLGILISSTLGASAFGVYYNTYHKPKLGEQPISVVIRGDKDKEARLRQIVSALLSSDRNIRSVWLYSWPDAQQVIPIMQAGDSTNPMPNGSFLITDAHLMGLFLFGECGELDRRGFDTHSCPINGFEDSWGVLVVTYHDNSDAESRAITNAKAKAAAHRIGLILYSNSLHVGSFATYNKLAK